MSFIISVFIVQYSYSASVKRHAVKLAVTFRNADLYTPSTFKGRFLGVVTGEIATVRCY